MSKPRTPLEVLDLYPPHDGSLYGAFAARVAVRGDSPFLHFENRSWSWTEFDRHVIAAAHALASIGIERGDRVAIMARNSDRHVLLLLATARIGAILVPVNPDFLAMETGHALTLAKVAAVACDKDRLAIVRQACEARSIAPRIIGLDADDARDTDNLANLAANAPEVDLPIDIKATEPGLIIFTSGTTGFPKGALHSQANYVLAGEAFVERMRLTPEDRVLAIFPLFHINALFYSVAGAIMAGASLVVLQKFSASRFWETVHDFGITQTNIMEAAETILVQRPRSEFRPGHRLRKIYGVRPPADAVFRGEFGVPHLITGYGMTEIPATLTSPFDGIQKPGSMGVLGRHPDPNRPWTECRIVDDNGKELGDGEIGELLVRSPIAMLEYFGDPEQTARAFDDGWFRTGDLVRRDSDGYFYFVSRKKDIIRRRGENIAAIEVEAVINRMPGIEESAVLAAEAELGEEILAIVVPLDGHAPTHEAIAAWCGERLSAMKVPRYIAIAGRLPHTATHKIDKPALRADRALIASARDMQGGSTDKSHAAGKVAAANQQQSI